MKAPIARPKRIRNPQSKLKHLAAIHPGDRRVTPRSVLAVITKGNTPAHLPGIVFGVRAGEDSRDPIQNHPQIAGGPSSNEAGIIRVLYRVPGLAWLSLFSFSFSSFFSSVVDYS